MKSEEKNKLYNALLVTLSFLLVCWALFLMDAELGYNIKNWGLKPREAKGLIGILSVHFLHKDYEHIINNSWAFLVLNMYLFFFYRSVAYKVFPIMLIFSAVLLWIWGRSGNHIGASVIIYGLSSFLFFSGLFRKSLPLMAVSALVLFSYGSMLWGVFPIQPEMSWEGHLSGALMGLLCAYYYKEDGPQRKKYQWELDEEREQLVFDSTTYEEITLEEALEYKRMLDESSIHHSHHSYEAPVQINYNYREQKKKD